jgi:aldehyde dehydrogenase
MTNQEQVIADIAREVVARLRAQLQQPTSAPPPPVNGSGTSGSSPERRGARFIDVAQAGRPTADSSIAGRDGVFATVDEAANAAAAAQQRVAEMSLEGRGKMIAIIRRICNDRREELGRMELEETKVGRLDHKIQKLEAIRSVLGVEAMRSDARSDRSGLCVIERAPWGVIGMVLPVTHSVPTMAGNAINVLAGGNTALFAPHPSAKRVAQYALQLFNREIERECGVANVMTTIAEPSIEAAEQIFQHPKVALLCVTGGPMVVKAAMKHGKRVIAAGPGNPPVVVDETADFDAAAKAIIEGGGFDNNLLCIGEKEGNGKGCARAHVKKELVGKDVAVLAAAAGVTVPSGTSLLFGETEESHAFVVEEQMMPFIPVVRVKDIDAAIAASLKAEHGYRHTALIHSRNVENVTRMAKAMNTTLFVCNAASPAALGLNGPGYLSYSIATPTGEGVTTPLTFTRERQLSMGNALRII